MQKLGHFVLINREYVGSFRAGGIATYIKVMSEFLALQGHKVTVIHASDDTRVQSTCIQNNVNVIYLSGGDFYSPKFEKNPFWFKKLRFAYRFFSYRYKLKKTIEKIPDISLIEVSDYGAEGLFLQRLNTPLFMRLSYPSNYDIYTNGIKKLKFNNIHYFWIGWLELQLVRKSKFITSLSNSLKQWYITNADISPEKIEVIYNGVALSEWQTEGEKPKRDNFIFFAGTLNTNKGIFDLIEAVKNIRKSNKNLKLIIAGKLTKEFLVKQSALNLDESWCELLGHLPRPELKKYFQRAQLCCFPSYFDNFPNVCLEALSAGGVILTTVHGGMVEIIRDGVNGFIINPGNVELLEHKINSILALSELEKDKISVAARQTIKEQLSLEFIAKKKIEYFNSCLASLKM